MPVLIQIALGCAVLLTCSVIHIWIIGKLIVLLRRKGAVQGTVASGDMFKYTSMVFLLLLASHTVQIYVWAASLWALGALPGYESQIYFSLVSYTTLGYGDVTLGVSHRIFGALSSVTGILTFGLSTAFLVAFFPDWRRIDDWMYGNLLPKTQIGAFQLFAKTSGNHPSGQMLRYSLMSALNSRPTFSAELPEHAKLNC